MHHQQSAEDLRARRLRPEDRRPRADADRRRRRTTSTTWRPSAPRSGTCSTTTGRFVKRQRTHEKRPRASPDCAESGSRSSSARFYARSRRLARGRRAARAARLRRRDERHRSVYDVPGCFELPLACAQPDRRASSVDGVVALGRRDPRRNAALRYRRRRMRARHHGRAALPPACRSASAC